MKEKIKDILLRAGKTFVQTAGSCLIAGLSGVDLFAPETDGAFWTALLLSALAAGLSAVWNSLIPVKNEKAAGG